MSYQILKDIIKLQLLTQNLQKDRQIVQWNRKPRTRYLAKLELQINGENDKFLNMKIAGIIHLRKIKGNGSFPHPICVYICVYVCVCIQLQLH